MHFLIISLCMCFAALGCQEENEIPVTELVNPKIKSAEGDFSSGIFIPYGNFLIKPDFSSHKFSAITHTYHSIKDSLTFPSVRLTPSTWHPRTGESISEHIFSSCNSYSFVHEQMETGYYSIILNNGMRIEASLSKHCGMHSYQFMQRDCNGIILSLGDPHHPDSIQQTVIQQTSNRTLEGYHLSTLDSIKRTIYFRIEFSQDINILDPDSSQKISVGTETILKRHRTWIRLGSVTDKIFAKISLSPQSIAEARNYLQAEIPHWSFEKVKRDAKLQWKKLLSHVKIKSNDTLALQDFYSALYHAYPTLLLYFGIKENYKNADGDPQDIYYYLQKYQEEATKHVLSSMGLIPIKGYTNQYQLSRPLFSKIILKLEQDRRFTIKTDYNNHANTSSIILNGRPLQRTWITRSEITQGGTLEFILTNEQENNK